MTYQHLRQPSPPAGRDEFRARAAGLLRQLEATDVGQVVAAIIAYASQPGGRDASRLGDEHDASLQVLHAG